MRNIPPSVKKPSRYSGAEVRTPLLPWEEADTRVLLAFPDVYEIGMSHLGILLLYELVNARRKTLCERVFAPWRDMEEHLRATGSPLVSLESARPARDFDVLGFSLSYELTYTNVLAMLDLAGIPLLRTNRRESDPVILGGGVCTLNPAPVAEFFDALLVGDGEEAILEIVDRVEDRKRRSGNRDALLRDLSEIEGVYVPGVSAKVSRRVLPDLAMSPLIPSPILPAMRVVHDRLSIEISRGCTRGCRFCQAGYAYRPVRERDPLLLLRYLQEVAPKTGYDEVGLLSLSAADYGCIDRLITDAMETLSPEESPCPSLPFGWTRSGRTPCARSGRSGRPGSRSRRRQARRGSGGPSTRRWTTATSCARPSGFSPTGGRGSSSTSWWGSPGRRRTTCARSGNWSGRCPRSHAGTGGGTS